MSVPRSLSFLRRVLLADAVGSGLSGVAMLLFAVPIAGALDLPVDLVREPGIALLPFAAFVAFVATRERPPTTLVWAVIALNVVWVVESLVLLLGDWAEPNAVGRAVIVAQALAVAVLAELEYFGLRRQRMADGGTRTV